MTLTEVARIPLPEHPEDGGFDHAAVDAPSDRLFVAHPSNDAVEVVDLAHRKHLRTISGLTGVAGVWVDSGSRLLFTSNRGEDTACAFKIGTDGEEELFRTPTGVRPNGMAYDPGRRALLVAGVGTPALSDAFPSLTFIRVDDGRVLGTLRAPGRTRWATFHAPTDSFFVNIANPPAIATISAADPSSIRKIIEMPERGPHGMEQDPGGDLLYCACDSAALLAIQLPSGAASVIGRLAGVPDVLWLDPSLRHLYAATDENPSVEVFGTAPPAHLQTYPTAPGAHTLTVDTRRHEVHVFLPETHEDLVLRDTPGPSG